MRTNRFVFAFFKLLTKCSVALWRNQAARLAHNQKVAGSNPAGAPNLHGPGIWMLCLRPFFFFLLLSNALAQQSSIRELDAFDQLRTQVQDLNRTRYIKGRFSAGDGGGGLFAFTNTVLFTNAGTRLQVAGKNYSWERMHDGVVNIKWFGAKGDPSNITDDTAAIQACLDYCYDNNFTTFIPSGTFGVVSTLVVKDNAKVVGAGQRSILYGMATTHTMTLSSRTNVLLRDFQFGGTSEGPLYINGSSRCKFDNLLISGAILNFGVQVTAGIHFEGCTDLTFNDPIFDGNGMGITNSSVFDYNMMGGTDGLSSTNILVNHPIIRNNRAKYGIVWYRAHSHKGVAPDIDMGLIGSTNDISGYGLVSYGRIGEFNDNIEWVSPTVRNAYGSGIYFNLTKGGAVTAPQLNNVAQSQTTAASLLPAGISVNNSTGIKLESVMITNSGISSAIAFSQTTNCGVIGGTIEGVGTNKYGVQFSGNNFGPVVKGVHFSATLSARRAIAMDAGNVIVGADIEGNTIDGWYDGIILLAGCTNNIVRGNRIYNDTNTGIQDFGSYNTIDDNIVSGGGIGIYAAGDNGLIGLNTVVAHATGLLLVGSSYRVNPIGRYHDNAIAISDPGGSIIKTLTSGTTPSVKNSSIYYLQYSAPTSITDFTDGLPGMRRTFFVANTNVTIVHGTPIVLDGNNNFNMKLGDSLTLERHPSGVWIQVGKSINSNYLQYDRAAEILKINAPLQDFNTTVQVTAPSAATYPEDHALTTNTTASALIARWIALGNQNAFVIKTTAAKTNYVFTFDGVDYQFPTTNGVSGQVLASDGTTPQHLYWTNGTGGGSSYTFDPTQFSSAGGLVALTNGVPTTNQVLKGAVTAPTLDVSGVNIDASTGTEFSKALASNTTMGIISMANDETIHFTVTNTTFTLGFTNTLGTGTNQLTWISGVVPVINTNAVNVFHFSKKGGRIFGSDPEQVANINVAGLAGLTGTGVVVKTNSTTFTTFDPLPIRYGGTGTNAFTASSLNGNIVFYNSAAQSLDADDGAFQWIKAVGTLGISRAVPTGQPQIIIVEAGGVVPLMQIFANRIQEGNDDLYLEALTGGHSIFGQINGTNGFELTPDYSFVAGGGSTITTRTNHFFYLPTSAGAPTGIPVTQTGHVAMDYDTVAKHLYVYQGGWNQIDSTGGAAIMFGTVSNNVAVSGLLAVDATKTNGIAATLAHMTNAFGLTGDTAKFINGAGVLATPSSGSDNDNITAVSGSTTNDFLVGNLFLNVITATNGFASPGGGLLSGNSLGLPNSGGAGTISNPSATRLSHLDIKGGTGAETYMQFFSSNIVVGSWDTNRMLNAFYGIRADSLQTTNGIFPLSVGTLKAVRTDSTGKLAELLFGPNMTFDGTTLDSVSGGDNDNTTAVSGSLTNDFLVGNLFLNQITATNGLKTGTATYSAATAGMVNSGGAATVLNNSSSRLSHLDVKGGTGAETYLQFFSRNAASGSFDTNQVFNAFFGLKSDSSVVTNASTIGMGTSGSFARVGGTVFIYTTPIGNVGAGEDDLMTYPVTGGTLVNTNDTIRFHCSGQWAGNGNTKQLKAYFGTSQSFATGAQAFNNTDWVIDVEIIRLSATGQLANVRWSSGDTLLTSSAKVSFPVETLSGTVVFKLTGEGVNNNDVLQRSEVVEILPAP